MDYYEMLIERLKRLLQDENYTEAYAILDEELRMPYIPYRYVDHLEAMFIQCKQELQIENRVKKYQSEDIETLLFGSVDEACMACELLRESNVRNYISIINQYLRDKPHYMIRTLLIEILMDQDISEEIELSYEGLSIAFIPAYIERIQKRETTAMMVQMLQDFFMNDNPTFYQMCVDCLIRELYYRLPFSLEVDEVLYLVVAIVEYVYKANRDDVGKNRFIDEKNLAKYKGYDLLLYEYDVSYD